MWSNLENVCTKEQGEELDLKYLNVFWNICWIDLLVSNVKIANNDEFATIMMLWSKYSEDCIIDSKGCRKWNFVCNESIQICI